MFDFHTSLGLVPLLWVCVFVGHVHAADDGARVVERKCLNCHAPPKAKGGLDLTQRSRLLQGGEGGPAFDEADPGASLLAEKVHEGEMPPGQALGAADRMALDAWLKAGAPYPEGGLRPLKAGPDFWSFQPVRAVEVPDVRDPTWARNAIDRFILNQLDEHAITPAPEADRRTLLRRLCLDLTGLPPSAEDIEEFLRDPSSDAYERWVDRLLADPAYGERWGRHWLDVARFAESHGYETNQLRPNAWPYRDWVIRAFNQDLPFQRFVHEQFAGDQLADADGLTKAATGFLVAGTHDVVGNQAEAGRKQQRADDLDDLIAATGIAFLGLSLQCARCHDHKFDPISQRDYYALAAIFAGMEHAERDLPAPDAESRAARRAIVTRDLTRWKEDLEKRVPLAQPGNTTPNRLAVDARGNTEKFQPVAARVVRMTIEATTDGLEPCIDELEIWTAADERRNVALGAAGATARASSVFPNNPLHTLEHLNDGRFGNGRSWISAERGRGWVEVTLAKTEVINRVTWARDREAKYADRLAKTYRVEAAPCPEGPFTVVASSDDRAAPGTPPPAELAEMRSKIEAAETELANLGDAMKVYAGRFQPNPGPTHVLTRGDPMRPAAEVAPATPLNLGRSVVLEAASTDPDRRLALADWLGGNENALAARVLVNRLWMHHFGAGLVATPGDFGSQGDRPSHPKLLEWLTARFREEGGRLKPLHRLMVTSATYRQSSLGEARAIEVDSANRLLARMRPRRLEAEAIRDGLLVACGRLDRRMGGPGYSVWEPNTNYVVVFTPLTDPGAASWRRMVYQFRPRGQLDPVFGGFDCPDAALVAPRRERSTTPLQALNLLNGAFLMGQCEALAERVSREVGDDPGLQVQRAFQRVLGRTPTDDEALSAKKFVESFGLANLARVLFNTNEFLFLP